MENADISQSLARLLTGINDQDKAFKGSAFFVDPQHLLTAKHCTLKLKPDEALYIAPYAGHGSRKVTVLAHHPKRDCALLKIEDSKFLSTYSIAIPRSSEIPEKETAMTVWGFVPEIDRPDPRKRTVLEYLESIESIRLDSSIAFGMSGGPVIDQNDQLSGILYARSDDSDCHYVAPIAEITDWLDQQVTLSRAQHLPSWTNEYFRILKQKLEEVPTDQMLRQVAGEQQGSHQLKTRALYVPLHVPGGKAQHLAQNTDEHSPPTELKESERVEPLLEALARRGRLVVRGDPGCGKSTFLRYLTLRLCGRLQGEPPQPNEHEETLPNAFDRSLPLFIELKDFYKIHLNPSGNPLTHPPTPRQIDNAIKTCLIESTPCLEDTSHNNPNHRIETLHEHALKRIWLLDGLDEINLDNQSRERLIEGLGNWAENLLAEDSVCLTTRPYAYTGKNLPHFDTAKVEPLAQEQIERFIQRFCVEHGGMFQPDSDRKTLRALAQSLIHVIRKPERKALLDISASPLLLTLTTALYCKHGEEVLPKDRGELYKNCLNALLERWKEKYKHSHETQPYHLLELVGGQDKLNAILEHLGFHAHLGLTEAETKDRENGDLSKQQIEAAFALHATSDCPTPLIIDYLHNHTGLINDRDGGQFGFIHRSFREYLAARYLIKTNAISDLNAATNAAQTDPGWWREVVALAARLGDQLENPLGSNALLLHFLKFDPRDLPFEFGHNEAWRYAEMVAHAEAERDSVCLGSDVSRQTLRRRCIKWLVTLIEDDHLSHYPEQRNQAAITLSHLGDPRKGVECNVEYSNVPDIEWIEVPEGTIELENEAGKFNINPPILIAKYPITNAQFQAFVDDNNGYTNKKWWEGFEKQKSSPSPSNWQESNHPKTDCSWYEAVAYSRWLTFQLHCCEVIEQEAEIRLPTEWEWQQAATGGNPENTYPWGAECEACHTNIDETDRFSNDEVIGSEFLGRTTAVGLYHSGKTSQGVYDMAGNVWEWCLNKYEEPIDSEMDRSGDWRVVRGGSWGSRASSARASCRNDYRPVNRFNFLGFRLLLCPPSSGTGH